MKLASDNRCVGEDRLYRVRIDTIAAAFVARGLTKAERDALRARLSTFLTAIGAI